MHEPLGSGVHIDIPGAIGNCVIELRTLHVIVHIEHVASLDAPALAHAEHGSDAYEIGIFEAWHIGRQELHEAAYPLPSFTQSLAPCKGRAVLLEIGQMRAVECHASRLPRKRKALIVDQI